MVFFLLPAQFSLLCLCYLFDFNFANKQNSNSAPAKNLKPLGDCMIWDRQPRLPPYSNTFSKHRHKQTTLNLSQANI